MYEEIEISKVIVKERMRPLDMDVVRGIADSIKEVGLLMPIVVDWSYVLVDGNHRLEAYKLLGKKTIKAIRDGFDVWESVLCEIDSNLMRKDLTALERADHLQRRKEVYVHMHPETRATNQGGCFRGNQHTKEVTEIISTTKTEPISFAKDAAQKLGVSARTIRQEVAIAEKIEPEVKAFIQKTPDLADKKTALLKIAKAEPVAQMALAQRLADGAPLAEIKKDAPKIENFVDALISENTPSQDGKTPDSAINQGKKGVYILHEKRYNDAHYISIVVIAESEEQAKQYNPQTLKFDLDTYVQDGKAQASNEWANSSKLVAAKRLGAADDLLPLGDVNYLIDEEEILSDEEK